MIIDQIELLKHKAEVICNRAIIAKVETNDLDYQEKLNIGILAIFEANTNKQLLKATNELEALIKPERHYGELVEGTKSTRKINKH